MSLTSRLESFPFDAMLLPLLVTFIVSVRFFERSKSFALAAAIAKADAFGPAGTAEDVEME